MFQLQLFAQRRSLLYLSSILQLNFPEKIIKTRMTELVCFGIQLFNIQQASGFVRQRFCTFCNIIVILVKVIEFIAIWMAFWYCSAAAPQPVGATVKSRWRAVIEKQCFITLVCYRIAKDSQPSQPASQPCRLSDSLTGLLTSAKVSRTLSIHLCQYLYPVSSGIASLFSIYVAYLFVCGRGQP